MGEGIKRYPMSDAVGRDLANRFTYHPPFGDQTERYMTLRSAAVRMAALIVETTPPSREQSRALTHLEDAIFSANAAIARHESPPADTITPDPTQPRF